MSDAFRQKQAELMAATIAKNDIVICTALVMGRRAPVIVTAPMVESMKAGSVIVDLAAEAGGNCALTEPGDEHRDRQRRAHPGLAQLAGPHRGRRQLRCTRATC